MEHLPCIGPRRADLWLMSWKMNPTVSEHSLTLRVWWLHESGSLVLGSLILGVQVTIKDSTWNMAEIFMHQVTTRRSFAIVFKGLLLPSTIPNVSIVLSCWNPDEALKASQQEMPNIKIHPVPSEWRNQAKCILYFPLRIPSVSLPKGSYVIYL